MGSVDSSVAGSFNEYNVCAIHIVSFGDILNLLPASCCKVLVLKAEGGVWYTTFSLFSLTINSASLQYSNISSASLCSLGTCFKEELILSLFFVKNIAEIKYFSSGICFSISFSLSLIQIRLSVLRAQSKSLRFALLAILSTGFPLLVVSALVITDYQNAFFEFALAIIFVALTVQFRFIFSFPKYKL